MIKLNLIANGTEQERIKEFLENNASLSLAEKINNGVKIIKDNKTLINKKDLNGFWSYATEEARKRVEKNSRGAYVDDETVFSWAIHYFEENSIEGHLFNEDGTEYKPVIKTTPKPEIKKEVKKENSQASLFDFMDIHTQDDIVDDSFSEDEEKEIMKQEANIITTENNMSIDIDTGEILNYRPEEDEPADNELIKMLYSQFESKMEVRI